MKMDDDGLMKEAAERTAQLTRKVEKLASDYVSNATMDELFYGLHRARETLHRITNSQISPWWNGTPMWKWAHEAPAQYEQAIRLRNASLCHEARLHMYKNSGLV